jgi:hypothetical protein
LQEEQTALNKTIKKPKKMPINLRKNENL